MAKPRRVDETGYIKGLRRKARMLEVHRKVELICKILGVREGDPPVETWAFEDTETGYFFRVTDEAAFEATVHDDNERILFAFCSGFHAEPIRAFRNEQAWIDRLLFLHGVADGARILAERMAQRMDSTALREAFGVPHDMPADPGLEE